MNDIKKEFEEKFTELIKLNTPEYKTARFFKMGIMPDDILQWVEEKISQPKQMKIAKLIN